MHEPQALVVVIEDDAQIRRFVRATLDAHGIGAIEAESAAAGLRETATRKPDLIVMDLGLPDANGLDVIRELRSWTQTPVIVLSPRATEDAKVAALDAGADDYLTKSFGVPARVHGAFAAEAGERSRAARAYRHGNGRRIPIGGHAGDTLKYLEYAILHPRRPRTGADRRACHASSLAARGCARAARRRRRRPALESDLHGRAARGHHRTLYRHDARGSREPAQVMPFVIVDCRNDRVAGSTRFWKVDRVNRKQEIGHTWLAESTQRTGINTETKLLLLAHAFDVMQCVRVQFTDRRAQREIARGDSRHRRETGRHRAARAHHAGRAQAQLGALFDHQRRMARRQSDAARQARAPGVLKRVFEVDTAGISVAIQSDEDFTPEGRPWISSFTARRYAGTRRYRHAGRVHRCARAASRRQRARGNRRGRLALYRAVRRCALPHGRDAFLRPAAREHVGHAARRHRAMGRTEARADAGSARRTRAANCDWAVARGLLAIRTHVGDERLLAVEALLEVKRRVKPYIDLQLVAFPQDGVLRNAGAFENLKRAIAMGVDVGGGIPHFEHTMADGAASVKLLCEFAAEKGLRVDMHCDESDDPMSRHIETLAAETHRLGLHGLVTGSHLTSMHIRWTTTTSAS